MTFPRLSEADARAADAMQAAYFRTFLADERNQLADIATKRRDELTRRMGDSQLSAVGRLRAQLRSTEAELRYVDRLLDGLDRRFFA